MKKTVTEKQINEILSKSKIIDEVAFNKCSIVKVLLPNGFILVESSACVDESNFDHELGKKICLERIKNHLWELEGFKLQCELNGVVYE